MNINKLMLALLPGQSVFLPPPQKFLLFRKEARETGKGSVQGMMVQK